MSFYESSGHFLLQMILNIFHKKNVFHHNVNLGDILGNHPLKFTFSFLKNIHEQRKSNMCTGDNFEIQNLKKKIIIVFKILKKILNEFYLWKTKLLKFQALKFFLDQLQNFEYLFCMDYIA